MVAAAGDRIDGWWSRKTAIGDSRRARVLVFMQSGRFQIERNGAGIKPQRSTPKFALDNAVVVIDGFTRDRAALRRCGQDPGDGSAQAEDRPSRCRTVAALAAGESLSPGVGSDAGAARHAAVAVASPQVGGHAAAGEERVAASGAESGSAAEAQAVERSRTSAVARAAADGLDGTAAPG